MIYLRRQIWVPLNLLTDIIPIVVLPDLSFGDNNEICYEDSRYIQNKNEWEPDTDCRIDKPTYGPPTDWPHNFCVETLRHPRPFRNDVGLPRKYIRYTYENPSQVWLYSDLFCYTD